MKDSVTIYAIWSAKLKSYYHEDVCPHNDQNVQENEIVTQNNLYASSKSSRANMFTFGQIPLGKVWTPLSSQLWVK